MTKAELQAEVARLRERERHRTAAARQAALEAKVAERAATDAEVARQVVAFLRLVSPEATVAEVEAHLRSRGVRVRWGRVASVVAAFRSAQTGSRTAVASFQNGGHTA